MSQFHCDHYRHIIPWAHQYWNYHIGFLLDSHHPHPHYRHHQDQYHHQRQRHQDHHQRHQDHHQRHQDHHHHQDPVPDVSW